MAVIGLVGTIFTGSILKYFDYRLNKMKHEFHKQSTIKSMYQEDLNSLREELESRKEEMRELEESLDEWKHKYYELMEELLSIQKELKLGGE